MEKFTSKMILIGCSLFFSFTVIAGNTFDDQRPHDINNQKWSTLKSAAQEAKLLPEPIGIGGDDDNLGASVSVDGDRAIIGGPNMIGTGAVMVLEFNGLDWQEVAVLKPTDGEGLDNFGQSVSISGDRVLVGAPNNDGNDFNSGSAYIYDYDGMTWTQSSKLIASDGEGTDSFGYSVSLSGDRALVGALGDDDYGYNSGAAYVYDFDGQNWSQGTKLTALDGAPESYFGLTVSLSGDRALVGAYKDADPVNESGSAYVFDYDGMLWTQTTKLKASDASTFDHFGYSVSLSGDRALVGAKDDDDNGSNSGSAYIYDYDGMIWTQTTKLSADDATMDDWFGFSVSLSGDTALIGAWGDDDSGSNSGSAYVFEYDGINWLQSDKLTETDGAAYDNFGRSVHLSGSRTLIGAWYDDEVGTDSGSAFVFDNVGSIWTQNAKLTAREGAAHDLFGYSVSLFGNRALVGAYGDDDQGDYSGAAYIFDYDGYFWLLTAKLSIDDGTDYKQLGHSVSLFNNRALVGAKGDNENGPGAGSAYVFDYDGLSWSQTAKLTADDGAPSDVFGASVSLFSDRALVGAWGDNDHGNDSGSAYIYDYDGINWIQTAKLTADDGAFRDNFGHSVSLSTDRALIGAYGDADSGNESGSAYIFDFDGLIWTQTTKLGASDGATRDYFGRSVSLSGDRALVGAWGDDDNGSNSGSVYMFEYDGMNWTQSVKLTADDGAANDNFGISVSLYGDRALVGALDDDDKGSSSGSAYVIDYDGISWSERVKLTAADGAPGDGFGISVSLSNDNVLVGAFGDDDYGTASGSSYVFNLLPKYNLNVDVTGLNGGNLVLQNNDDSLTFSSDHIQTISILDDGSSYDIDITNQPTMPNQTCQFISPDSGLINGADVTVNIECITNQYSVGGTVSGLANGSSVTLQNNAGDDLVVSAEGNFTFNTLLDDGTAYDVSVLTQPTSPHQLCTVSYSSGFLTGENVTDIQVYCASQVHTIGGAVSDLASGNFVTLSINNGDEYLVVNSNSPFTFSNALANGSPYDVTVLLNPTTPNQSCTVNNGSGTLQGTDIADIEVSCTISQYIIGGYVNGLIPDNYMVLQNNLSDDLIVSNQGAFAFPTPLDDQQNYDVTIKTQPNDPIQDCEVINGDGSLTGSDIENIFLVCVFGDDLIYRHGFDTPEAISRSLWEPED
jgi:hypothetical protein